MIDYDKLIVLDKGVIAEFDTPWNLIQKEDGIFRNMPLKPSNFLSILLDNSRLTSFQLRDKFEQIVHLNIIFGSRHDLRYSQGPVAVVVPVLEVSAVIFDGVYEQRRRSLLDGAR